MSEGPNQFDRFVPNLKPSETPMGGTFRRAGEDEVGAENVVDFQGTREARMQEEMMRLRPEAVSGNEAERRKNVEKLGNWLLRQNLHARDVLNPGKPQRLAAEALGVPAWEIGFCAKEIGRSDEEKRRNTGRGSAAR